MSETEVTVRGHLGATPALQVATTGKAWVRLRVATNRSIRTPEGWVDGNASWYDVKLWGNVARNVAESLRKGDRVIVQGPLEIEEFVTDKGVTMRNAVIHARAIGPDLTGAVARISKVIRDEAGSVLEQPPVDVSRMQEVGGEAGRDPFDGDVGLEDGEPIGQHEEAPDLVDA